MPVEHSYPRKHDGTEFPIAFLSHTFFGNTEKMKHHWTGSLLCHYQMELLFPRNQYHSAKWSQGHSTNSLMEKNAYNKVTDGDWS